ncbi:MAG: amino acid ABC transporter substrate-binding protein [Chloroflexales bacterium]|nr:amino acid ABC transporter substrate-binding protein [Chloroflexales bacterium]
MSARAGLLLLVILALAGCAPLAPAREAILFGATISITGVTAKEGEHTRDGYMLFVDAVNAAGGVAVGGRRYPVRLRYYDDESRPERAAELYERLVAEDQVDFLLGPYGSGPTAVAAEVAARHGLPMVEGSGAADSLFATGNPYLFGVLSPASAYLRGIIDLAVAAEPPLRTVAIVGADNSFASEVADGAAAYARERGLELVASVRYPSGSQDLGPELGRLRALAPDLLLGAGHLQDALLVARQSQDVGLRPRAMGFSVGPSSPEFRQRLRADADYVLGATQWTPALTYVGDDLWGTPGAFAAAFRARYPHYATVPYTAASSAACLVAYQYAIEAAGSLAPEAVRAALAELDVMTFYGPIAFDERGANAAKPMAVEQLLPDGGQYTVYPPEMAERAALFPGAP